MSTSRGCIAFATTEECDEFVVLYTHWKGNDLPALALTAIEAAFPRWGDPSYATRIALTALIGDVTETGGWGVATDVPWDIDKPTIVIDWTAKRLCLVPMNISGWSEHRLALSYFLERVKWMDFMSPTDIESDLQEAWFNG